MSLWEYQAAAHGFNERNRAGNDDGAPVPTAEDWARLHANVERATKG